MSDDLLLAEHSLADSRSVTITPRRAWLSSSSSVSMETRGRRRGWIDVTEEADDGGGGGGGDADPRRGFFLAPAARAKYDDEREEKNTSSVSCWK